MSIIFKYKIEKTDDSEEDEEEDFGAPAIQENLEDDSIARNYYILWSIIHGIKIII